MKGLVVIVGIVISATCARLAYKYSKKNSLSIPPHQLAAMAGAAVAFLAIVIIKFLHHMGWYFD